MNRATLAAILAAMIGIGTVPSVIAGTSTTDAARVAGALTKIDGRTLIITPSGEKKVVITCADDTRLAKDGVKDAMLTLEDFKVSQPVRAYYSKSDNVALAVIIAKTQKAAKPR